MLESFLNKVAGLQVFFCEYCKIVRSSFFCRTPPVAASSDVLVYIIFSIRRCWIYCSFNCIIVSFWNKNLSHLLSFVVPLFVVRFLSLSFIASLFHWLSLAVPLVVTRCTNRCHSLSFVVPLDVIRCHSLSLVVPLVVTRCTTRLSFYKRSAKLQVFTLLANQFFLFFFLKMATKIRSSHHRCSIKKGVLKNFAIFTRKHLCSSFFLTKLQAFRPSEIHINTWKTLKTVFTIIA